MKEFLGPNKLLHEKLKNVKQSNVLAFNSALIVGMLTHIYFFITNSINEDNLGYITYEAYHLRSGRWAPSIFTYMLPMVIGVFAILLLSFTAVAVIYILDINKPLYVILTSGLIVTFPTLAYSFGYLFMIDNYIIALFFATLSVLLTKKFKFGFIIGAVFLSISLGEYQSYIAFAMGLCVIDIILTILRGDAKRLWLNKIKQYLYMGSLGSILYYIILKICLLVNKTELLSYKGINEIGKISITQIPELIIKTYSRFFGFFSGDLFFYTSKFISLVYLCMIIMLFCLIILISVENKITKSYFNIVSITILLLMLPLCLNFVDFMAAKSESNNLNIYAFVLIFIFNLALLEMIDQDKIVINNFNNKIKIFINYTTIILCFIICVNYFVSSNIYYLKLSKYYQYTVAINNRILSRIEQLEGFTIDTPVAFIADNVINIYGNDEMMDFSKVIPSDQGLRDRFIGFSEAAGDYTIASWKITTLINNLLGVNLTRATSDQISNIEKGQEILDMGIWPSKDSVTIIDGIAVVNFTYLANINYKILDGGILFTTQIGENIPGDSKYAWYIYRDGTRCDVQWYSEDDTFYYKTSEPGEYYSLLFVQSADGKLLLQEKSEKITIN